MRAFSYSIFFNNSLSKDLQAVPAGAPDVSSGAQRAVTCAGAASAPVTDGRRAVSTFGHRTLLAYSEQLRHRSVIN